MSKSLKTTTSTKLKSSSETLTKKAYTAGEAKKQPSNEAGKIPKRLPTSTASKQKTTATSVSNKRIVADKVKPQSKTATSSVTSSNLTTKYPSSSLYSSNKSRTTSVASYATQQTGKVPSTKIKSQTTNSTVKAKPSIQSKANTYETKVTKNVSSKSDSKTTSVKTKPNAVLDTYHNVTVTSPPSKRKEITPNDSPATSPEKTEKRSRKLTRTLEPDEVLILKRESAKQRLEAQNTAENQKTLHKPLAFEVNFDKEDKKEKKEPAKAPNTKDESKENIEEERNDYSDDFESYESDFEASSSSNRSSVIISQTSELSSHEEASEVSSSGETDSDDSINEEEKEEISRTSLETETKDELEDDEDESEVTQNPITVIHREREQDRKLDSGNYELNSQKKPKLADIASQSTQNQYDSLETFSFNTSEQLDSGISSYESMQALEMKKSIKSQSFYGGYVNFISKPIFNERGRDLMTKIKFDTLTFILLDLKPISYDVYMQTYGKLYTTQVSTQTQDNLLNMETQTDDFTNRSIWTQHPPLYNKESLTFIQNSPYNGIVTQNCCGEDEENSPEKVYKSQHDSFEESIMKLQEFHQAEAKRNLQRQLNAFNKPIDFERLNIFLKNSSILISNILNQNNKNQVRPQTDTKLTTIATSFYNIGTPFLNALRVVRIFTNSKYNMIITVHECLPEVDVYRSDFAQLLMVWSTNEPLKPLRLLSTWSEVGHAEICNRSRDIIVCGLRDGSLAMWDLCESYSYCSKLDGHVTHFAATQTVVPFMKDSTKDTNHSLDLGVVIDVKSFRNPVKPMSYNGTALSNEPIQFVSLNETGILTLWTLVEVTSNNLDSLKANPNLNNKFEYHSPWARVKLIQSGISDLRAYLGRGFTKAPTQFDKTKTLFQSNIYNDEVLKELISTSSSKEQAQQAIQGLRFTCLGTGCERIYICTNQTFIISCSRSFKTERFRKIPINNSRFLFPTALTVLSTEDFIAIGLSNGSVHILNCQQGQNLSKPSKTRSVKTADTPSVLSTRNVDSDYGKSCAIQNIILNERRSFDATIDKDNDFNYNDSRPTTAACLSMITQQKRPFELRIFDQQLILSGSSLRQDLVKRLILSSDGWKLFVLSNDRLRVYDFYMERELNWSETDGIKDIATNCNSGNEQYLVTLDNNQADVRVFLLNQ